MKREPLSRAMLLTPPGSAAIAVVRLRGPAVEIFLKNHFSKNPLPQHCVHGNLLDGQRIIDDPVIVLSSDRQTLDINLHGSDWIVQECFELARRSGFAIVEHCDDLLDGNTALEREVLAALPLAQTEQAIRALLIQPELWNTFIERNLNLHKPGLQARVGNTDVNVRVELSRILDDRSLHWMLHPPRAAIVGIPNAGKSTLANQLFGQTRSITADVPGTTRDWVSDFANLDGLPILLLDTPGQRDSRDPIEQSAIARSHDQIAAVDLIILLIDPTQEKSPQDELIARYPQALRISNKSDLPSRWNMSGALQISATSGIGLAQLIKKIREHFQLNDFSITAHPRWWTERQKEILQQALRDPLALKKM
jgi:tRNA modification GTPase